MLFIAQNNAFLTSSSEKMLHFSIIHTLLTLQINIYTLEYVLKKTGFIMGNPKKVNLVLSGGGIKGIAYLGVFDTAEKLGYTFENIAGVSAGALAGSYAAAGYKAHELKKIIDEFDFGKTKIGDVSKKVPAVERYMEFRKRRPGNDYSNIQSFLESEARKGNAVFDNIPPDLSMRQRNLLSAISVFCKEGALFDGDYIEEWVYRILMQRGIKTFADLKGGKVDKTNPQGYKVRMTAVDVNRAKVVVLPDDISFYGMDPDKLEVARAVRMSISVPFAFKAVEIKKKEGNYFKTYNIVDGGVFDNFPFWLIDREKQNNLIGFRITDGNKGVFSLNTPLKILKMLISAVHDIGIPDNLVYPPYVGIIDASKVSFLDFDLTEEDKRYLYYKGKTSARLVFNKYHAHLPKVYKIGFHAFLKRLFKGKER